MNHSSIFNIKAIKKFNCRSRELCERSESALNGEFVLSPLRNLFLFFMTFGTNVIFLFKKINKYDLSFFTIYFNILNIDNILLLMII